jgi:hypothetical protein
MVLGEAAAITCLEVGEPEKCIFVEGIVMQQTILHT